LRVFSQSLGPDSAALPVLRGAMSDNAISKIKWSDDFVFIGLNQILFTIKTIGQAKNAKAVATIRSYSGSRYKIEITISVLQ
jgi:hypothetical protein